LQYKKKVAGGGHLCSNPAEKHRATEQPQCVCCLKERLGDGSIDHADTCDVENNQPGVLGMCLLQQSAGKCLGTSAIQMPDNRNEQALLRRVALGEFAGLLLLLLGMLLRLRERPLRSRACFSQSLAIVDRQPAEHQASNNHGEFDQIARSVACVKFHFS
jgi:hypothetical protein